MTYKEANKELLKVKWKTKECGTKDCWCRMIVPQEPILFDDDEEGVYIAGGGVLRKEHAEYIVNLHNQSL